MRKSEHRDGRVKDASHAVRRRWRLLGIYPAPMSGDCRGPCDRGADTAAVFIEPGDIAIFFLCRPCAEYLAGECERRGGSVTFFACETIKRLRG